MTLGMICPKSWHESLAQVGSAQGPPPGQPPPRARRAAGPGQGRRLPCRAARGTWHVARGRVDSWELDVERGSNPGPRCPLGSFLVLPFHERTAGMEPKETAAAASRSLAHASGMDSCTPGGLRPPVRRPAEGETAQGHAWEGGGGRLGEERRETVHLLCSAPRA